MQTTIPILPDAIYSEDSLVLALGLTAETFRRARRSGLLRYSRPGKRPVYLGQWVIDWLQTQSKCEEVPA